MLGHLEARLTGVMVSALKEAFDRDAARLDLERAALDDQRRRAEEALRLELVRQRPRLVFGAADPRAGACGSLYNLCSDPRLNHAVPITRDVRAGEAAALLAEFFASRRPAR